MTYSCIFSRYKKSHEDIQHMPDWLTLSIASKSFHSAGIRHCKLSDKSNSSQFSNLTPSWSNIRHCNEITTKINFSCAAPSYGHHPKYKFTRPLEVPVRKVLTATTWLSLSSGSWRKAEVLFNCWILPLASAFKDMTRFYSAKHNKAISDIVQHNLLSLYSTKENVSWILKECCCVGEDVYNSQKKKKKKETKEKTLLHYPGVAFFSGAQLNKEIQLLRNREIEIDRL